MTGPRALPVVPLRGIPGQSDHGERFKVRYSDGNGRRRTFGYTDDLAKARSWVVRIHANPLWTKVRVVDRKE